MFTVTIRDHVMIAHSLPSPTFGPAQQLHGATYVVDVTFKRPALDADHIVIDIGRATELLRRVLDPLRYQNLDELDVFADTLTTTEYLAYYLFEQIAEAVRGDFEGRIAVRLGESHVAWAGYEGEVGPQA